MELFGEQLALGTGIFLILALLMALSFEFVNGFRDTANDPGLCAARCSDILGCTVRCVQRVGPEVKMSEGARLAAPEERSKAHRGIHFEDLPNKPGSRFILGRFRAPQPAHPPTAGICVIAAIERLIAAF